MPTFRIVMNSPGETEITEDARSPEHAIKQALGSALMRSGNPSNLACKVYWNDGSSLNMVKFYYRVGSRQGARAAPASNGDHHGNL